MVGSGSPYPQEDNEGGNEAVFQLESDHGEQSSLNEGRNLRGNSGRATDGRAGHRADNLNERCAGTARAVQSKPRGRRQRQIHPGAPAGRGGPRGHAPAVRGALVSTSEPRPPPRRGPAFQVAEHQGSSVMLGSRRSSWSSASRTSFQVSGSGSSGRAMLSAAVRGRAGRRAILARRSRATRTATPCSQLPKESRLADRSRPLGEDEESGLTGILGIVSVVQHVPGKHSIPLRRGGGQGREGGLILRLRKRSNSSRSEISGRCSPPGRCGD